MTAGFTRLSFPYLKASIKSSINEEGTQFVSVVPCGKDNEIESAYYGRTIGEETEINGSEINLKHEHEVLTIVIVDKEVVRTRAVFGYPHWPTRD